jgi:hypothetical protein
VVAKFAEGAWITVLLIPLLVMLFRWVGHHYASVEKAVELDRPMRFESGQPPVVIVPIREWSRIAEQALNFAMCISKDIIALHVQIDEDHTKELNRQWDRIVTTPCEECNMPVPQLKIVYSPYRRLLGPILDIVHSVRKETPSRHVAVIIPELQELPWHQLLLHNHRATALKAGLLFLGDDKIVTISVPWYLNRSVGPPDETETTPAPKPSRRRPSRGSS